MSRTIIFVLTCPRDQENGRNFAVRDTWVRTWGTLVDVKFVYARDRIEPLMDELVVDANTGYMDLPEVSHLAHCWALKHGYDNVFVANVDTFIVVPRLMQSHFRGHKYVGLRVPGENYASGGCGYWLSREACEILAATKPPVGYEDKVSGEILFTAGVHLTNDPRFVAAPYEQPPFHENCVWDTGTISVHLSRGTNVYDSRWMRMCHESYMESQCQK